MEQPIMAIDDNTRITLINSSAAESDNILSGKTLDANSPATISNELETKYAVSEFNYTRESLYFLELKPKRLFPKA